MNINKDGKTLYFSDEEIGALQDGEKKVFVTKRINGKESHVKADKVKGNAGKYNNSAEDDAIFSFKDEFVIGVNRAENNNKNQKSKKEKKKKRKFWQRKNKEKTENKLKQEKDWNKSKKYENKNESKKEKKREKIKQSKKKKEIKVKQPRLKKISIKNKKPLIIIATSLMLLIVIAVLALTAPIFNITKINIEGNNIVQQETILNLSGLKKGENIFKFNKSVISNIKENAYIQDVIIKRKLPNTVIINVKERTIKYQLKLVNSYVYIDKNGYILEISDKRAEAPIITGLKITEDEMMSSKKLDDEDSKEISKISKIIESAKTIEINDLITEINLENKNNYVLYLESENKKINLGDLTNLTNKMLYIKKILEKEKGHSGIIFVNGDINQGFKPYFREE